MWAIGEFSTFFPLTLLFASSILCIILSFSLVLLCAVFSCFVFVLLTLIDFDIAVNCNQVKPVISVTEHSTCKGKHVSIKKSMQI